MALAWEKDMDHIIYHMVQAIFVSFYRNYIFQSQIESIDSHILYSTEVSSYLELYRSVLSSNKTLGLSEYLFQGYKDILDILKIMMTGNSLCFESVMLKFPLSLPKIKTQPFSRHHYYLRAFQCPYDFDNRYADRLRVFFQFVLVVVTLAF